MSGFTVDTRQLNQMGAYLGAMDSEIKTSSVKASNQAATWLRRQFVDEVARMGPEKKLVRALVNINRAKNGRPYATVNPSGWRLYADSFDNRRVETAGTNSTRARIKVPGFQEERTAIGFVNPEAKSGDPKALRTKTAKGPLKQPEPALGPSPAILFYDFFAANSDLENDIYLTLTAYFEEHLTEAMNQR